MSSEVMEVFRSPQIDYKQKVLSHPSYRYDPQFNNSFGQTITLGSSQIPVTINLPATEVYNLSESYLMYSVNLPAAGAGNFIWMALQPLREISQLQFYTTNGQWIANITNLQNYLDIVLKKEMSLEDFLSLDPLCGFSANNAATNAILSIRNTNQWSTATAAGSLQITEANKNYTEPSYFQVSGAANAAIAYTIQFPLRLIKNTIFSVNKDLYFGQVAFVKAYFGPIAKICFQSTSNNGPSDGPNVQYAPTTAAVGATIPFQLMLAIETNQAMRDEIVTQANTTGLKLSIPYVQNFVTSGQGTSQTVSIPLDQGYGFSLVKCYHALYNINENLDTAYDRSNALTAARPGTIMPRKLSLYYTQINGRRNQDINIDCTANGGYLDYLSHKKQLVGSVTQNRDIYQYNWFHCDDWSGFNARYDQDNENELISGLPMSSAPLVWSFVAQNVRAEIDNAVAHLQYTNHFQHYTYFVFMKKLFISPGQVMIN